MTDQDANFDERLSNAAHSVQAMLTTLLDSETLSEETARPERLMAAMRHGVLNGGKRMRPFFVLETARLFDGPAHAALRVAAALECVHCYSLIHDDLPAMDNDDTRRGQPTVHKAFDDATAILAGDALLTYAFDILADEATEIASTAKVKLMLKLARASGLGGMAGGQMLDLQAETSTPDETGIITLQAMKTGALIRFACEAGPILAGASENDLRRLTDYGRKIGLAFQLADDLLDLTADSATLGKAAGKDAAKGKGTLPALHGIDWTRTRLAALVEEAEALLSPYGEKAAVLKAAARFVANRKN
ncbi:farnesyl diphosphate synthase [Ensifer adhaerens]|nr:farnesyl diphosphate synthase [Ensifer adhaerens]